jgi:hypothetical protein
MNFPHIGHESDTELHWVGAAAGGDTGGVPGPTDVHIQALAVLPSDALASGASRYEWKPAPSGWDTKVSPGLRPFLPAGGTWQVSEPFAADLRTTRYNGSVYLESSSGTVFLDVIGR